jgi:hypothetical protein
MDRNRGGWRDCSSHRQDSWACQIYDPIIALTHHLANSTSRSSSSQFDSDLVNSDSPIGDLSGIDRPVAWK